MVRLREAIARTRQGQVRIAELQAESTQSRLADEPEAQQRILQDIGRPMLQVIASYA